MGSQTDLDQGGTFRQNQSVYMGPSIGWMPAPFSVVLAVTTSGTTTVQPGNTLVTVNFAGPITIQLPIAKGNLAGAGAVPGSYLGVPITVVDISGAANTNNITILPFGTEKIDGLSSIKIQSAYGAWSLRPDLVNGGWVVQQ